MGALSKRQTDLNTACLLFFVEIVNILVFKLIPMKFRFLSYIAILVFVLLSSCKKEENYTYLQMLTGSSSKSWVLEGLFADTLARDNAVQQAIDLTNEIDSMVKGYTYVYTDISGGMISDTNASVADLSSNFKILKKPAADSLEPEILLDGYWSFNDNETSIIYETEDSYEEYLLSGLSNSGFTLLVMNTKDFNRNLWIYPIVKDAVKELNGGELLLIKFKRAG